MKRINRKIIIYLLMILLQILVFVYWAGCKTNYHIDELYSMGYASNYTGFGNKGNYITINHADFRFNEWLNVSDLQEHLIINREESVLKMPPLSLIKGIFTDKNFFILLNIVGTIAGIDHVSAVPGLVLNIFLFVVAELLLIRFMKKLGMDERICFLSVAMYGFSGYMISTVEYIRFYMFVTFLLIAVLNLFYNLWNTVTWREIIINQGLILVLTFLSFRNSEFTIPLFAALTGCFIIATIIKKKKKQIVTGLVVCMGGLLYIMFTQDFIGILLRPDSYSGISQSYLSAGKAVHTASVGTIMASAGWLKGLFETAYFGTRSIIILLAAALTISFLAASHNDSVNVYPELKRVRPQTIITFVIWLGIYGISTYIGRGRFVCIVVLYLIVVVFIKELLGYEIRQIKITLSSDTVFVMIVACSATLLAIFEILCEFDIWRYYCFVFTLATTTFWYLVDRVLKRKVFCGSKKHMTVVLAVFVFLNALIPFATRNIENMYEDEREFIAAVKQSEGLDTVLIVSDDNGTVSRHETYDCINLMPADSKIYVVDVARYGETDIDYPEEFMLWTHSERDISNVLSDVGKRGYDVNEIGTDHCSRAFICKHHG